MLVESLQNALNHLLVRVVGASIEDSVQQFERLKRGPQSLFLTLQVAEHRVDKDRRKLTLVLISKYGDSLQMFENICSFPA